MAFYGKWVDARKAKIIIVIDTPKLRVEIPDFAEMMGRTIGNGD
jgi:hypothetical protein